MVLCVFVSELDSNDGINKQSEEAMKNKTIVILTLLIMVGIGIVGNAFANPTDESRYPVSSNGATAVYSGHTYSR